MVRVLLVCGLTGCGINSPFMLVRIPELYYFLG